VDEVVHFRQWVKQIWVNKMTGSRLKEGSKWIMIVQSGFLAQVVHKTKECLNHVNNLHLPNVISKRIRPSSKDAHKRELNAHERIFETT